MFTERERCPDQLLAEILDFNVEFLLEEKSSAVIKYSFLPWKSYSNICHPRYRRWSFSRAPCVTGAGTVGAHVAGSALVWYLLTAGPS